MNHRAVLLIDNVKLTKQMKIEIVMSQEMNRAWFLIGFWSFIHWFKHIACFYYNLHDLQPYDVAILIMIPVFIYVASTMKTGSHWRGQTISVHSFDWLEKED